MFYEYKIIEKKYQDLDEMLNTLGKQGWELCGIYEHTFIFKRIYTQTYSPPYVITSTNTSLGTALNNESD